MLRYASSHRSYLIGFSLIGLMALAILLVAQASAPVAPAVQPRAQSNEAASGIVVDPLANVNPADRKFYQSWHAPSTGIAGEVAVPANVDPADRKFYNNANVPSIGTATESIVPAGVHPADRKFFIREYAPGTSR